jgi:hypothetical protein
VRKFVKAFTESAQWASLGAQVGLYAPLAGTWFGDKIGLTPQASAEKRRAFASPRHNRSAAAEVREWIPTAHQAKASGPLNPDWPVAVVTAARALRHVGLQDVQSAPARLSRHGYEDHVVGASHTTLLGVSHSDAVVRGIEHVLNAAKAAKG